VTGSGGRRCAFLALLKKATCLRTGTAMRAEIARSATVDRVGVTGRQFFTSSRAKSAAYRVSASDERQRNREN
jgi:hypothetical protein